MIDAAPAPESTPERLAARPQSIHGPEGDALLEEVRASLGPLSALLAHGEHLERPVLDAVRATVADVEAKLARREIAVVVVGEKGAGKTTFFNALLGDRLLGAAGLERASVTILRHGAVAGYQARFAKGHTERFEARFPDESGAATARIEAAEAALPEAQAERDRAAGEIAAAEEAAARARSALEAGFREFEAARERAERLGRDAAAADAARSRLERAAAERGAALPALVRAAPPRWAFWLWIARALVLLVRWRAWREHRAASGELERARVHAAATHATLRPAAAECLQAEARLNPLSAPVEAAERALAAARGRLATLTERLESLRGEAEAARAGLERGRTERRRRFFDEVQALSDPRSRGEDVVALEITYPSRFLPEDIALLDAPGVTADSAAEQERAWEGIRERADGCILLSELQRAVSGSTKTFLKRVRELVPHVVLVLTKMDQAFKDAMHKDTREPWEHVERARRIGTRRFAREIGREPDTVLSVTVAAESALRQGGAPGLALRFEAEVAKLFQLLRQERALILAARCAGLVRRCIAGVKDAEERAERAYQARIAALERQRAPAPETFRAEHLDAAEPRIRDAAADVVTSARAVIRDGLGLVRIGCVTEVDACSNKRELLALAPQWERAIAAGTQRVQEELSRHVAAWSDAAVRDIESVVFDALRKRYGITHEVTRSSSASLDVDGLTAAGGAPELALAGAVEPVVARAARSFTNQRVGLGAGGAAAGAIVGTLLLPGIGTAAGAAIGALLTFARPLGALKQRCKEALEARLQESERLLTERIERAEPAILESLRAVLDHSVERATVRFGRWIAEPLEAERAAIERERARLSELQAIREQLDRHADQLDSLGKAAADASLGLCR